MMFQLNRRYPMTHRLAFVFKIAAVLSALSERGLQPAMGNCSVNAACLLATFMLLSVGCQTHPLSDCVIGPSYQVSNVYELAPRLPERLRRVALLPLAANPDQPETQAGQEALTPVLQSELLKTQRFEVVLLSPDQLQLWTGRLAWSTDQKLPPDFFKVLHEEAGVDAVLFGRLTIFRPYPPVAVGWRLTLVDCIDQQILWATDEVFDSGDRTVVNAARRFQQSQQREQGALEDSTSILNSPRRFGQYTACTLLMTLPAR